MQETSDFLSSWNPGHPVHYDKVYSQTQQRQLEKHFRMDAYPDYKTRVVLAARLNLKEHQVKDWFLSRRAEDPGLKCQHHQRRVQRFLGLSLRRSLGLHTSHTRIYEVIPYSTAEGSSGKLPLVSPWAFLPEEEPNFCSGPGYSTQKGVEGIEIAAATAWPQGPCVSDLSSLDTATCWGSTELISAQEDFQRLFISATTSGYQARGGIDTKNTAGPERF